MNGRCAEWPGHSGVSRFFGIFNRPSSILMSLAHFAHIHHDHHSPAVAALLQPVTAVIPSPANPRRHFYALFFDDVIFVCGRVGWMRAGLSLAGVCSGTEWCVVLCVLTATAALYMPTMPHTCDPWCAVPCFSSHCLGRNRSTNSICAPNVAPVPQA